MNLHEYQAKKLLHNYGILVPPGKPANTIEQALQIADELGGEGWVVKAQVHAGGRGKAGGVKLVNNREELESSVRSLLGSKLVTQQSAPTGQRVNRVLIAAMTDVVSEFYLAMLVDRVSRRVTIIVSTEGGMDIEQVAAAQPEKIISIGIDPILGLQSHQSRRIGFALELDKQQRQQLDQLLKKLYQLYLDTDLSLVEINPLVLNEQGNLIALDAKITVDDNALFRQAEIFKWYDPSQEDEKESVAKRFDLSYVTLDGNIACMVNGAGLAMATMDIIKLHGGTPANFLDVGGNATAERVAEALKLIVSDKRVKAILVNIFGGIVRCDLISEGIIKAVEEVGVELPIVVRLEGTNSEAGKAVLAACDFAITPADDLTDAAEKVVMVADGGQ